MKKVISIFFATVVTAAVLTGCGSDGTLVNNNGNSGSSDSPSSSSSTESAPSSSSPVESGTDDEDEYINEDGRLGDTMHTYFFDYTVNSAYLCDEYEGYTPESGKELLVADITIKNTSRSSIPMYDTDFQIQWNDDAEDAFDAPITYAHLDDGEVLSDEMLPGEYELTIGKSISGLLVYEVPAGNKDFSISYLEMFDDDTTGDVYFVYFSAEKQ